jgi:hypothetical protein
MMMLDLSSFERHPGSPKRAYMLCGTPRYAQFAAPRLKQSRADWSFADVLLVAAKWAAAGSMDTGLSFLSFLELYRTDVAEC